MFMVIKSAICSKWAVWLLLIYLLNISAFTQAQQIAPDKTRLISSTQINDSLSTPLSLFSAPPAEGYREFAIQGVELIAAVRQTVHRHPAIAESVGRLLQRNEQIGIAHAQYYPRINAGIKAGYDSSYQDSGYSQAFALSASQVLYDFGKVSSSVRVAEAGLVEQQAGILLTIDQIARETAQTLLEIQRYQNLLLIAEQQLTGLNNIAALARDRNLKGASSRSDVVQSESRIEGARSIYQQYMAYLERWRGALAMLLGVPQIISVAETFPDHLNSCSATQPNINDIPAILMAQAQRRQALAQLDNARAQTLPTISFDPSATHYFNDNHFAGNNRDRTQYAVTINFTVPLDSGGAIKAQQRAASYALQSSDSAIQAARLSARQSLLEAQNQTTGLQKNLEILQRRQALSAETRDLYRQQYLDLGTRPLLDLLNAEQEIHQSFIDYQNTVSDLRQLQLTCLYNTGLLRRVFQLENQTIQGVEILP